MKLRFAVATALAISALVPAAISQWLFVLPFAPSLLAQASASHIRFGQIGLRVTNPEEHKKLWVGLGGTATKIGDLDAIELPGAFLILTKAESSGGSDGSSL